jgi:hypothetical protein
VSGRTTIPTQEFLWVAAAFADGVLDPTHTRGFAGRPHGKSPRRGRPGELSTRRADDPALVPAEDGFLSLLAVVSAVRMAPDKVISDSLRAGPVRSLLKAPGPPGGLMAMGAAMRNDGCDPDAARSQLSAEVARRNEGEGCTGKQPFLPRRNGRSARSVG